VTALADRLVGAGIDRVTVESTSDYWRIWFYLLEAAGLAVQLVNARDVKNVPGRPKTDLDAVWLAKLTEKGLLRPSFVPPAPIRQLRDYTRLRVDLTRERARYWQRMEKLLEDALIKDLQPQDARAGPRVGLTPMHQVVERPQLVRQPGSLDGVTHRGPPQNPGHTRRDGAKADIATQPSRRDPVQPKCDNHASPVGARAGADCADPRNGKKPENAREILWRTAQLGITPGFIPRPIQLAGVACMLNEPAADRSRWP
jgi:transposase